jgi:hypothetical protein
MGRAEDAASPEGYFNGWRAIRREGSIALGRLQFIPAEFRYPCEVYRSRSDASVVALASGGTVVDADGFIAEDAAKSSWTSSLSSPAAR